MINIPGDAQKDCSVEVLLMTRTLHGITFELLRMLLVGAIIGVSGGVAANLFVLGVLLIDSLIIQSRRKSFLGADITRWLALITAALSSLGLKSLCYGSLAWTG